jgi:hypothetical protein
VVRIFYGSFEYQHIHRVVVKMLYKANAATATPPGK